MLFPLLRLSASRLMLWCASGGDLLLCTGRGWVRHWLTGGRSSRHFLSSGRSSSSSRATMQSRELVAGDELEELLTLDAGDLELELGWLARTVTAL